MVLEDRTNVVRAVVDKLGDRMGLAVAAALAVAAKRWTEEDTKHFGYVAQAIVQEED